MYCRVLIFVLSPFCILIDILGDDSWISKGSFMQAKHLYVLIHTKIKGVVGTVKLV